VVVSGLQPAFMQKEQIVYTGMARATSLQNFRIAPAKLSVLDAPETASPV